MRRLLLRSALASIGACAIVLFFAQYVHEVPVHTAPPVAKEVVVLSDDDFVSLAKNVYFEARGETEDGQRFVADVTLRRWLSGRSEFGGPTLRDVVYHKTTKIVKGRKITTPQFSWSLEDPAPEDMAAWETAQRIAREAWDKMLSLGDATPEVMWYMNPRTSDPRGRRWFKHNLVPVGFVVRHQAFREPTLGEKVKLFVADLFGEGPQAKAAEKKPHKKKQDKKNK